MVRVAARTTTTSSRGFGACGDRATGCARVASERGDCDVRCEPDALTWWSVRGGRAGQGAGFASQDLEVVVEVQRLHGQHSMVPGLYLEDLAATDP